MRRLVQRFAITMTYSASCGRPFLRERESGQQRGQILTGKRPLERAGRSLVPMLEPEQLITVLTWGALIGLVGAMLIYGAFRPLERPLILVVAGASKVVFIALVLSHGGRYAGEQVRIAVVIDLVMVLLFAWYLIAARVAPPVRRVG